MDMLTKDHDIAFAKLTKRICDDQSLLQNKPFMQAWCDAGMDFLWLAEGVNTGNQAGNFRGQGRSIERLWHVVAMVQARVGDFDKIYWPHLLHDIERMCKIVAFEYAHNVCHLSYDFNAELSLRNHHYQRGPVWE